MSKPVTPQDLFDLWQKMLNPGAFSMQNLMFPMLEIKEVEKKLAELEVVEHWLKANLNMIQLTAKGLEYQRAMLKGGEKARESLEESAREAAGESAPEEPQNPALWAWQMMADAQKAAMGSVQEPKRRKKKTE
jgi:hypothetical protein